MCKGVWCQGTPYKVNDGRVEWYMHHTNFSPAKISSPTIPLKQLSIMPRKLNIIPVL